MPDMKCLIDMCDAGTKLKGSPATVLGQLLQRSQPRHRVVGCKTTPQLQLWYCTHGCRLAQRKYSIEKRTCDDPVGDGDGEADPAAEVLWVALLLLPHGGLIGRVPAAQHDQLQAGEQAVAHGRYM